MRVTRIIIKYSDGNQIVLSVNFRTENIGLIRKSIREYYGAHHVLLNYEEE